MSRPGRDRRLDYGGKISGRIGRWDIGALSIRQDDTRRRRRTTTLSVARAANVLDESNVGIIATSGDPTRNLDNSLAGVDFHYPTRACPAAAALEPTPGTSKATPEGAVGDDRALRLACPHAEQQRLSRRHGSRALEDNFNPGLGYFDRRGIDELTAEIGNT